MSASPSPVVNSHDLACGSLALLDPSYFADLTWKANTPIANIANVLMSAGETLILILSIPFIFAGSFFAGMVRGLMPLFVLFVSVYRMMLRPALAIISDIWWAMTHNNTHRVIHKKIDGPFEPSPVLAALATAPPNTSRGGYEAV